MPEKAFIHDSYDFDCIVHVLPNAARSKDWRPSGARRQIITFGIIRHLHIPICAFFIS